MTLATALIQLVCLCAPPNVDLQFTFALKSGILTALIDRASNYDVVRSVLKIIRRSVYII